MFQQSSFPKVLNPGGKAYRDRFFEKSNLTTPMFTSIFHDRDPEGRWDMTRVAMSDVARIPERPSESGPIAPREFEEIGSQTFTQVEYAAGYTMGDRTLRVMPSEMVNAIPMLYADAANETLEYTAWGVMRNAFTTVGTIDSKAMCANDHPLTIGGTASNYATGTFSRSTLNSAIAAFKQFVTPQGRVISNVMPKYLVVPIALEAAAKEALGADIAGVAGGVFTAAQAAASWGLELMVVPWLSDTNDWFLVADPSSQLEGLESYILTPPTFRNGEDEQNLIWFGNVQAHATFGFTTWRQVWGASVT